MAFVLAIQASKRAPLYGNVGRVGYFKSTTVVEAPVFENVMTSSEERTSAATLKRTTVVEALTLGCTSASTRKWQERGLHGAASRRHDRIQLQLAVALSLFKPKLSVVLHGFTSLLQTVPTTQAPYKLPHYHGNQCR